MAEKEYIEREAFLKQKREQYCKDCGRRKGMRNGKYKTLYEIACEIDDVLNDVEDFPAADVRPVRHGRWGVKNECSECGCQPWFERDIHTLNFCPNCGSDMREGS